MSICNFFAYYTQYFTETELSLIFGVLGDNHNTNLALDKLIDVRILRKSKDEGGSEVYVLVDMLKMHLRYEVDAEIEESIGKDLQRLYREGNLIIESRKKRKRDDNDNDVQSSDSEEEEEENDDNDNDVQNSDSGEEEEENDDNDNNVHKSASEEEEEEDEAEDMNVYVL